MASKFVKLGDYITNYDELNLNGEFSSINDLQGISNEKYFQGCKSNKNDINLLRYRICRKGMFSYNKATSRNGEKISIAYRYGKDCLVSPSYQCFYINDEKKIIPEYLLLIFKRPIFDRFARFNSWGSATEFFTWETMQNLRIFLPTYNEQKNIVAKYKAAEARCKELLKIENKLQEIAYTFYLKLIKGKDKNGKLTDIALINMGTSPEGESLNTNGNGIIFYQGKTDFGFRFPEIRCFTTNPKKIAKKGDVLMSVRAPVGDLNIANSDCSIGRGIASLRSLDNHPSFLFYTLQKLYFELNEFNDKGTVFGSINKKELFNLPIVIPSADEIQVFEDRIRKIDKLIETYEQERVIQEKIINTIYMSLEWEDA